MHKIPYFQNISAQISAGAQPTLADLADLQKAGFTAVLNLSPVSTRNYLPEEESAVRSLAMEYRHLPIDCSQLDKALYEGFENALQALLKRPHAKVFLHCGMNIKSSGLLHIYRIRRLGQPVEQAEAALAETPGHEPKWRTFWASFGIGK